MVTTLRPTGQPPNQAGRNVYDYAGGRSQQDPAGYRQRAGQGLYSGYLNPTYPATDTATFESSIGEWTANAPLTMTRDATVSHSGSASLKVVSTAGFQSGFARDTFPGYKIPPGLLQFNGYFLAGQAATKMILTISWYNLAQVQIGASQEVVGGPSSAGAAVSNVTWTFLDSGAISPPDDAIYATIVIQPKDVGTFWVDDLYFGDYPQPSSDVSTSCAIYAGGWLQTDATADLSATALVPVGTSLAASPVAVGLSSLVAAGSRLADQQLAVGLSSIIAAGAAMNDAAVAVGLSSLIEAGTRLGAFPLGVGLSGLIEAGSALFASAATGDRTASVAIEAGSVLWTSGYSIGLSSSIVAGSGIGAASPIAISLSALIEAGARLGDNTVSIALSSLIEVGSSLYTASSGVGTSSWIAAGANVRTASATGDRTANAFIPAGAAFADAALQIGLGAVLSAGANLQGPPVALQLGASLITAGARSGSSGLGIALAARIEAGAATWALHTISVVLNGLVEIGAALYAGAPPLPGYITAGAAMWAAAYTVQLNTSALVSAGTMLRSGASRDATGIASQVSIGGTLWGVSSANISSSALIAAGARLGGVTTVDLPVLLAAIYAGGGIAAAAQREVAVNGLVAAGAALSGAADLEVTTSGLIVVGAAFLARTYSLISDLHHIAANPIIAEARVRHVAAAPRGSSPLLISSSNEHSVVIIVPAGPQERIVADGTPDQIA